MVDRERLIEMLMATFVDELDEHVSTINSGVLELEADSEPAQQKALSKLFRAAHSLKGAARAVDVAAIEAICHQLEDVFSALQDDRVPMTPELGSLLLEVADGIAEAGRLLRDRRTVTAELFGDLSQWLRLAVEGKPLPARDPAIPSDSGNEPQSDHESESGTASPATSGADTSREGESSLESESGSEEETKEHPTTGPQSGRPAGRRRSLGTTVRVAEEKLDSLMAQAGELLVARQRIEIRPREIAAVSELLAECRAAFQSIEQPLATTIQMNRHDPLVVRSPRLAARMEQVVRETGEQLRHLEAELERLQDRLQSDSRKLNHTGEALQEDIHRIRMLPFSEGCAGLDRAVRDAAQATRKTVDFAVEGGDIEVDRLVLEGLKDPLLHLVRNAVDHGLEDRETRLAAGKPEAGRLRVSATLRGSQVDITVSDDGRGLNRDAILSRLKARGLPEPRDDQELFRSIFIPGFSTASVITDLSGRGIGMDVVKSQLESLHGTLDLSSQPGFGTRFSLSVPLTLTTIAALFVRAGGQVLGIPSTNVGRLLRFRPNEIRRMSGQDVLSIGSSPIPVVDLASALELPGRKPLTDKPDYTAVMLTTGDRELIAVVDELINERDAVVKNLGPQIRRARHVSGATLLRTGGVALLLNVATLVRESSASESRLISESESKATQTTARRILVVDDSVTTRSLLKGILESAGYDVFSAVDGNDAWRQLQTADVELVVSDVDMPGLDGFDLTSRIRKSKELSRLPVVLVTSRDSDDDRARGVQSGADAYLVKSTFHQTHVLDTIQQLL